MAIDYPLIQMKKNYNSLSSHQKVIADFIIANIHDIASYSIGALAQKCNVSNTTVIRFLNKLGYQSYPDFKLDLVRELSASAVSGSNGEGIRKFEDGYQGIEPGASIPEIIRAVTLSASSSIHDMNQLVSPQKVESAVKLLCQADTVVFYGTGGSSAIAMDGFHKFLRLGLPVYFETNAHFAMIRIAHLPANSVIMLFSHTGESHDVLQCARQARDSGCKVVGITSYVNSSLADLSHVVLHSASYDISQYTDALVSRLVQLVLMDILFVSVASQREPESTRRIQMSREAIANQKNRAAHLKRRKPIES